MYENEINSLMERRKYLKDEITKLESSNRKLNFSLRELERYPNRLEEALFKIRENEREIVKLYGEYETAQLQIAHYRRLATEEVSKKIVSDYKKTVAPSFENLFKWRKVLRVRVTGEIKIKELEGQKADLKAYEKEIDVRAPILARKRSEYKELAETVLTPSSELLSKLYDCDQDWKQLEDDKRDVRDKIEEVDKEIEKRKKSILYQVSELHRRVDKIVSEIEHLKPLSRTEEALYKGIDKAYVREVNRKHKVLMAQVYLMEQMKEPELPSGVLTRIKATEKRSDKDINDVEEIFKTAENRGIMPEMYAKFEEYKDLKDKQEKKFFAKTKELKGVQKEHIERELVICEDAMIMVQDLKRDLRDIERVEYEGKYVFVDGERTLSEEAQEKELKDKIDLCDKSIKQLKAERETKGISDDDISEINWKLREIVDKRNTLAGNFNALSDANKNIKEMVFEGKYKDIEKCRATLPSRIQYLRRQLKEIEIRQELKEVFEENTKNIEKLAKLVKLHLKEFKEIKIEIKGFKSELVLARMQLEQVRKSRGL